MFAGVNKLVTIDLIMELFRKLLYVCMHTRMMRTPHCSRLTRRTHDYYNNNNRLNSIIALLQAPI